MASATLVGRENVDPDDPEAEERSSGEQHSQHEDAFLNDGNVSNVSNEPSPQLSDRAVSSLSSSSSSSSSRGGIASSVAPPPPDGGWGWVVVFASFMVNLIADGVSVSFGILFVDLVDYFGESKAKTSWVGSMFFSMPLLAGPIASYLSDRYGCRKVCIAGAFLAAGAFMVSVFATTLEVLFLTFTAAGLGLALCYVTSIVVVAYYFEKKRSLATGLSSCGTGVGTFIFPPLTMYLLDEYAWQGTLLILSGFFLNMVAFGALMRDLEPYPTGGKSSRCSYGPENSTLEDSERLCSSLVQLPTYLRDNVPFEVITEISSKEGGYLSSLLQQHPYLLGTGVTVNGKNQSPQVSSSDVKLAVATSRKIKMKREASASRKDKGTAHIFKDSSSAKLDSKHLCNTRFHRGSFTYRGAMLNIRRHRLRASSCPDIYRNSMITMDEGKSCACIKDMKELLLDMFDLSIFKNVQYTLFCISNFLLYACVDVPYVYVPDLAHSLNFDMESASYLISALGVLNTVGVVIVGYIGDKTWIDSSLLYSGFIAVGGLLVGIIPWITDYYGLASACGLYGFAISANYTLVPVIVVNLISLDSFTGAYGMLLLAQGIATFVGPPLAGMLFDLTGNYDVTFFATGFCIILSGIMAFPLDRLLCKKTEVVICKKEKQKQTSQSKVKFQEYPDEQNNSIREDEVSKTFFLPESHYQSWQ